MNVLFEILAHAVTNMPHTRREPSQEKAPLSLWALFFLSILLFVAMLVATYYALTH